MKKLIILAIAAVVAVAAALLLETDLARPASAEHRPGSLIFDGVERGAIAALRIASPTESIRLSVGESGVRVDEAFGYAANITNVHDTLTSLLSLRVLDVLSPKEASAAELDLVPGTQTNLPSRFVELFDRAGGSLGTLTVGAHHPFTGRFVSPDNGVTIIHVADGLFNLRATPQQWLLQDLPRLEESRVVDARITGGSGEPVHAIYTNGTFSLVDLSENETQREFMVSGLRRMFDRLQFNGIADPALTDEQTGLDKPVEFRATDDTGRIMTARVGATLPDNTGRYVRFALELEDREAVADGEAEQEDTALSDEIERENERLSRWVYILPLSRAADMMRCRSEYIEAPTEEPEDVEDTPEVVEDFGATEFETEPQEQPAAPATDEPVAGPPAAAETAAEPQVLNETP